MGTFAIISLVLSVLGMAVSAGMQERANKQNIEAAENINQQQIEYSRESAETANQQTIENYWSLYSPQAKVQQYKDAGLSPGLMYSMGGVSGTGQAAAQGMQPNLSIPTINPLINGNAMSDISSVFSQAAENDLTKAKTKETNQGIENLKQQIKESNATIKKIEAETHNTEVSTANLELQNKLLELDKKFAEATLEDRIQILKDQRELIEKNIEETIEKINGLHIENERKAEMIDAQIRKMNAEITKLGKESVLIEAQTLVAKAQEKLINAQKDLTNKQREELEQKIRVLTVQANKLESAPWTAESSGWIDKIINMAIDSMQGLTKGFEEAGIKINTEINETIKNTKNWIDNERRYPNSTEHWWEKKVFAQ